MLTRTRHTAKVVREEKVKAERGIKIGPLTENVAKLIEPAEVVKTKEPPAAEAPKGEGLVLSVLERAADESAFLARLADNPSEALEEYCTLTSEEKAALASGDIKKIEEWVGKLDERTATWLWCRLSQEKW